MKAHHDLANPQIHPAPILPQAPKGHGIHSPYLFEFIIRWYLMLRKSEVPGGDPAGCTVDVKKDKTMIPAMTAGGYVQCGSVREAYGSFLCKGSSVSEKYGALLYRISQWFNPEMIVELGTGLGISTLYLATGSPEAATAYH